MKTLAIILGVLGLVLGGCSTVKSRIQEKSAVFASLDPQTQSRIRQGLIDVGYTFDMVYMALGKPDEVRDRQTTDGKNTTWIYNTYWQEYEGSRVVGYRRFVYFDPILKSYRVYIEPVRQELYSEHVEDRTRVHFKDGHVESIETAKR